MGDDAPPAAQEAMPEPSAPSAWPRKAITAIFVVYVILCVVYIAIIPPHFGPDETLHSNTVKLLAERGEMPIALGGMRGGTGGGHPLHPPLYYLVLVPIYYLFRSPGTQVSAACIYAMRMVSVLWGLAALWQFVLLMREVFPRRPALWVGTLALVALLPEYLLLSCVVLNDISAVFFGALLLRAMVAMARGPATLRQAVWVGVVMALFAWSKAQMIMLLPLYGGWLVALVCTHRLKWREAARLGLVGYGLLFVLGSGWYIRNVTIYGSPMPPGLHEWGVRGPDGHLLTPWEIYTSGLVIDLLWRAIWGLWISVWVGPSWFLAPPPPGVTDVPVPAVVPYAALGVLSVLAVAGYLRATLAGRGAMRDRSESATTVRLALGLSYAEFGLIWAAVAYMAIFVHIGWYQGGRYLYPGIWGFGLFLTLGIVALAPRAERKLVWIAPGLLLLLNLLSMYNIIFFTNPAYAGW